MGNNSGKNDKLQKLKGSGPLRGEKSDKAFLLAGTWNFVCKDEAALKREREARAEEFIHKLYERRAPDKIERVEQMLIKGKTGSRWDFYVRCCEKYLEPPVDVSATMKDVVWEGFLCFDPEGVSFIQFKSGWSAKGWEYRVDGNKVTGVIADQGNWSVAMGGMKGKGTLGQYSFEMTRRAPIRESAADYIAGTWDFWNKVDNTLAAKVILSKDLKGTLRYMNGFEDDTWTYSIEGHAIISDQPLRSVGKFLKQVRRASDQHVVVEDQSGRRASIEEDASAGHLTLTCTPDGTLGLGSINHQHFEVWREL